MSQQQSINERFEKAIDDMVLINNYLAAEVCKLGYPTITKDLPTAGVAWDGERKKLLFMFNPVFAAKLTDEEFCFVVGHEAIHFINSHVFLLYEEIQKMIKAKKSNKDINTYKRKMNIAMDCVVNDSLINLYNFPKVLTEDPAISGKGKIFYGQEVVKTDCHDLTAREVFYMLPEDMPGGNDVENHELWESFLNPDGSLNKDFVDKIEELVNDNLQNSALSDKEMKMIHELKKDMQESSDPYVSKAGHAAIGNKRTVDGTDRRSLNWNKILYKFVDSFKPEDIWSKPNRKLVLNYPDIILPSWKDKEKEKIFCAIDSSGSIDHNALKLFVSVLRNTPKRFEIEAISFDTKCYEYDLFGKDSPKGGGGTNFQIIENYIQENCKKYPIAVFVLTDGDGTVVNPQYPKRWGWLLYGSCNTRFCDTMKHYRINDLLRTKNSL